MSGNKSLGDIKKLPRSRMTKNALKNYLSCSKLPPPRIGNTMGHSIMEGFNPNNPDTFEFILDKIANQTNESMQSYNNISIT